MLLARPDGRLRHSAEARNNAVYTVRNIAAIAHLRTKVVVVHREIGALLPLVID